MECSILVTYALCILAELFGGLIVSVIRHFGSL